MRISDWSSDVCSSDLGTKLVMLAGIVVETAADPTDVTGMRETRQRHVDRAARTEVDELLGRKHPATALAAHTLHNPVSHRSHVHAPVCSIVAWFFLTRSEGQTSELQSIMRI